MLWAAWSLIFAFVSQHYLASSNALDYSKWVVSWLFSYVNFQYSNQYFFFTDLLFIEEDIILELPSFKRSECQVPGFPGGSSATGVAGLVSDTLAACALGSCWSLTAGVWTSIANMKVPRDSAAAASNSPQGWMVTGGRTLDKIPINSTEVFIDGFGWTNGPNLNYTMVFHCQVEAAGTVFVIGNK